MSKKLEGNGLWESSRMMLPEHKERIRSRRRGIGKKLRPEIDSLEQERFGAVIATSMAQGLPVRLTTFGEFEDEHFVGVVERIDVFFGRVKLKLGEGDIVWLELRELVGAEAASSRDEAW